MGGLGQRASPRKGAVSGLDPPPICSYSRPEDVGPRGSCLRAAMDRLKVLRDGLPQTVPLRNPLVGRAMVVILQGSLSPGKFMKNAASRASSPQTTDSELRGPRNTGWDKSRSRVVCMEINK